MGLSLLDLMSICSRADVNRDILGDWEKKFPNHNELLRIIKKLRTMLEARLLERAINNETNAGFTKFLLKSKFGYKEEESNVTIIKSDSINISFDEGDDNEEN